MTSDQFKAWRAERGWTQAKAAAELGLAKRTLEMYEAGRRGDAEDRAVEIPRPVELACAALALGVTAWTPGMGAGDAPAAAG